ncbi:RNA methyltransferase [Parvularcula lutaonensis]|uniref:RNA methyltransferase n=1 Tax=Parvularcula lutaonensis TaxID=491923 RepID=A0ABV7MBW1_9PROT|nr:RNA methyltransferase [Parvularcula lutaonensis]GGY49253.1 tRNA (cytidine/uridine-2'-O-)-methyltransferase TrmJ [Parvularcula lutaonensis]
MNDTTREETQPLQPLIVLVRPQMGENIGAAARAMLNFGLTGMRIVAPRDGWPNPKAVAMAAGAGRVLDDARLFDTVEEAVADCSYVVATTARQRGLFLPVHDAEGAVKEIRTRQAGGERCAILFGGEKSGLATEDVARANAILTLPVNPEFSSLNLAQAVLLTAYEWRRSVDASLPFDSPYDDTPAPRQELDGMLAHLNGVLEEAGYFYPEDKRITMERNLRTMFTHARFTEAEIRLFRGMIRQLAYWGRGGSDS